MASPEATRFLWDGAIPLQIHLHDSEVTTLPPPPPALVLGPRIGYLPLLVPIIRPHFSSALPPGTDTVWFDYKGMPLKWYIPTGVLFDLLCAEPERPWNLTVHFRGYPSDVLTTCEGEDSIKWSFINSLKEAAYIINGNCKNIMSMSQADQLELWQSILKGNMESYLRVSSKLKLTPLCEGSALKRSPSSQSQTGNCDTNIGSSILTGRIPVRLYVRYAKEDFEELEDAATVDSWDNITYINRPVEFQLEEGKYITLKSAMELLLRDLFNFDFPFDVKTFNTKVEETEADSTSAAFETVTCESDAAQEESQAANQVELGSTRKSRIKLIRIQGIEPDLEIPLAWVFNNLANPEYFLHICVLVLCDTSS